MEPPAVEDPPALQKIDELTKKAHIHIQRFLDKAAPHKGYRWLCLGCLLLLYALRVALLDGFFIITYALAIYNLNLVLGFITPSVDPELEGPVLPSKNDDEYRPFVRRLPEMKFWCEAFSYPQFDLVVCLCVGGTVPHPASARSTSAADM